MTKCPNCGKEIVGFPALSRKDNKTKICAACGMREALTVFAKAMGEKFDERTRTPTMCICTMPECICQFQRHNTPITMCESKEIFDLCSKGVDFNDGYENKNP